MKYALINNQRVEAQKDMKGICPVCKQPVIAKCGQFRVNHWAHSKFASCDKWWESETEWHREWKNQFPEEWQEIIAYDDNTREKHVADIKTDQGFVIEFQHSHIKLEERISRELFYKNMVWVVDGTRLKLTFPRFYKSFHNGNIRFIPKTKIFILYHADESIPKEWLNSNVPVIMDFKNSTHQEHLKLLKDGEVKSFLWCILPIKSDRLTILYQLGREKFIELIKSGSLVFHYENIIDKVNEKITPQNQVIHTYKPLRRGRRWNL